jgi:hypothetical protein
MLSRLLTNSYSLPARPINKKLGIKVISDVDTLDLFRGIRSQVSSLLNGLDPKDLATMSLGLSHSLSRYVPCTWSRRTVTESN